jgi:hypothetical protein
MKKLTWVHINIIGFVVCAVLALGLYFGLIKPGKDKVEETNKAAESVETNGGTQQAVSQKETELKRTKEESAKTEAAWLVNARRYMPQLNYGSKVDIVKAYYDGTYITPSGRAYGLPDVPRVFGQWITEWYDAQKNQGITRNTSFPIPAFPADPNSLGDLASLTFPSSGGSWPVTVTARSFDEAMTHLERFNNMGGHGMPVVDNVALRGQSPFLEMTYNLAMYIIPNTEPPLKDPRVGGTGGTGGGGMGGMMPGGGRMPPMGGAPMGTPGGSMGGMSGGSGGGGGKGAE